MSNTVMNLTLDNMDFNNLFDTDNFHKQKNVRIWHTNVFGEYNSTVVGIINEDGTAISLGLSIVADCDQYNKKTGREIAYARAMFYPIKVTLEDFLNYIDYDENNYYNSIVSIKTLINKLGVNFYDTSIKSVWSFLPEDIIVNFDRDYFQNSANVIKQRYNEAVVKPVEHLLENN